MRAVKASFQVCLVTGATGFIGRALVKKLSDNGYVVKSVVRGGGGDVAHVLGSEIKINDITSSIDWRPALDGVDVVIHLAARTHIMRDRSPDPLAEYRRINVDGSLTLASQAADAGVKRFIYLSSIKVNGEFTCLGHPFHPDDDPMPHDAYGKSKHEAEVGLQAIARNSKIDVVIIRPPLVYGPGVKANFLNLIKLISSSIPLPFGAVKNKRSLVSLENLLDFIITCTIHPKAANEVFLVSDGSDVSTPELIKGIAQALGRPAILLSVPQVFLRLISNIFSSNNSLSRILNSLQVDISKNKRLLNWTPPASVEAGLDKSVMDFLSKNK